MLNKAYGNAQCKFDFLLKFQFLATIQMISSRSVVFGPDYVTLNWPHPKFPPEMYQLNYVFTMKPTCMSNHETNNDMMIITQILCSDTTSVTIPNPCRSSNCMLNLLAVYNPASIDTGIVITGTTIYEDTKMIKSG